MESEAGRILSERYRLVRPVGQGSQASVWIADHLALNTFVAVKLIDPELGKKEDARERFRREATAAAQLRSAHVVQILDHGIDGDDPFIVMELLEGEDLFERLDKRHRLSLRETSKILTQVARALARAHAAGIVHRDLKPENVFLCANEDDEIVKVLDFGVAKISDPAKITMQRTGVGTLIGTPHYMSPEQVKGIVEVDFRTDLWALGIIAFQCVTGELPFDSEGVGDLLIRITVGEAPIPSNVYASIPASFDAWFARACHRDPARRFDSAREAAEALAKLVAGLPESIRGELPPRPSRRAPPPLPSRPRATEPPSWTDPNDFGDESSWPPAPPTAAAQPSAAAPEPAAPPVRRPAETMDQSHVHEDLDDAFAIPGVTNRPQMESVEVVFTPGVPSAEEAAQAAPARTSAPPQPGPGQVESGRLGPPVIEAGRVSAPPASTPQPPPPAFRPSAPTPPPSQPHAGRVIPGTVSAFESSGRVTPLPEFDPARRRRTIRLVAFAFVLLGIGIVFTVIRSQMLPPPPTVGSESGTSLSEPDAAAPVASVSAQPSASAKSAPPPKQTAVPRKGTPAPTRPAPRPANTVQKKSSKDDFTIVIPHPAD
jgi:serine/threonine-protein kinase